MSKPEWRDWPKEPWDEDNPQGEHGILVACTNAYDPDDIQDRIKACVNACAGIRNPAAVPDLVETVAALKEHAEAFRDEVREQWDKFGETTMPQGPAWTFTEDVLKWTTRALAALDASPEES